MLSSGVIRLNDNARPHVATIVHNALAQKAWEVLARPAYCPDMSPRDFHFFETIKKALGAQRVYSDDDVMDAVKKWFKEQPPSFLADDIRGFPKQWDACLKTFGDFF